MDTQDVWWSRGGPYVSSITWCVSQDGKAVGRFLWGLGRVSAVAAGQNSQNVSRDTPRSSTTRGGGKGEGDRSIYMYARVRFRSTPDRESETVAGRRSAHRRARLPHRLARGSRSASSPPHGPPSRRAAGSSTAVSPPPVSPPPEEASPPSPLTQRGQVGAGGGDGPVRRRPARGGAAGVGRRMAAKMTGAMTRRSSSWWR